MPGEKSRSEKGLDARTREKRLKASELWFRALFEAASEGILIADLETRKFVSANPAVCGMLGYSAEELVAMAVEDIHPKEFLGNVLASFQEQARGERLVAPAVPCRRKDGSILYADVSSKTAVLDGQECLVGFFTDVTERVRTEEALRASEQRYRELFGHMSSCVAVYEVRSDGEDFVFVDFNEAAERAEAMRREDLLGKSVQTVFPGVREFGLFEVFQRVWRTGIPEHHPVAEYRDKRIYGWRENYIYKLPSGEVVAIYEDVTERKQVEEELRASEERHRNLVERAKDGIIIIQDGMLKFANPGIAKMWGGTVAELMDTRFADYVHPDELDHVVDRYQRRMAGEPVPSIYETALRRKDGSKVYAELNAGIITHDGRPADFVIVRDITERKEAEERIRWVSSLPAENPNPVLRIASDGTLLYGNKASEPVLQAWACDVGRAVPPRYRDLVQRTFEEGPQTDEVQLGDRFLLVTFSPVAAEGYVNVYSADITRRKLVETALRQSEEKYRLVVESASEAIFIVQDRCIAFANPATARLVEYTVEEIVGQPFVRFLHPEDRATVIERHQRRLAGEAVDTNYVSRVINGKGGVRWASINAVRVEWQGRPATLNLVSDITEHREAETERELLLERQLVLNRITLSLGVLTDLPSVLRTLHNEVRTLLDADGFFVSRYYKDTGLITALFVVDEGVERDASTFPPIPLAPEGKGMQSQVLRTGRPLNIRNWIERERTMQTVYHIAPDGAFTAPPPEDEREKCTKSALLVPMMLQGEPVGVLQVQSNRLNAYSDEDVDLLAGLANVAAISIQDALLVEEVRDGLEGTIEALARTTEMRDPYTAGHQRRVSQLACAIAEKMGLAEKTVEGLRVSGLLHDVGKVSVPAEILSKPSALTPLEFSLVREHVRTGFDVLKEIVFPWPVAEMVLQHHERLDGSGYPRGLKGNAICLEARILAVADVLEAMASHRPYRSALGADKALAELEAGAGVLYDPAVVEACVQLFSEGYTIPPSLPEANAV